MQFCASSSYCGKCDVSCAGDGGGDVSFMVNWLDLPLVFRISHSTCCSVWQIYDRLFSQRKLDPRTGSVERTEYHVRKTWQMKSSIPQRPKTDAELIVVWCKLTVFLWTVSAVHWRMPSYYQVKLEKKLQTSPLITSWSVWMIWWWWDVTETSLPHPHTCLMVIKRSPFTLGTGFTAYINTVLIKTED